MRLHGQTVSLGYASRRGRSGNIGRSKTDQSTIIIHENLGAFNKVRLSGVGGSNSKSSDGITLPEAKLGGLSKCAGQMPFCPECRESVQNAGWHFPRVSKSKKTPIFQVFPPCDGQAPQAAFDSFTAQTLYSGIFETGSSAELVSRLAAALAK